MQGPYLNNMNRIMRHIKESIIGKRGSGLYRLGNLPLKYENLFIPGNVITVRDTHVTPECSDYIVISQEFCNFGPLSGNHYAFKNEKYILVAYNDDKRFCRYSFWHDLEKTFPKSHFPISKEFPNVRIAGIRGRIPQEELKRITDIDSLKDIYKKYKLVPA